MGVKTVEKTKIIGQGTEARQQFGGHLAALATRLEFPKRLRDVTGRTFKGNRRQAGRLLPMILCKAGLVVEGVDMTDSPGAIDYQHLFGRGMIMGWSVGIGLVRVDVGPNRSLATEVGRVVGSQKTVLGKQACETETTQSSARIAHEVAAVQQTVPD